MKRDEQVTALLWNNGIFNHRRSCVGYDSQMVPHLKLCGPDMQYQRERIYRKSKGRCKVCRIPVSWDDFELDHIVSKGMGGYDEALNLQVLCHDCHIRKHNRYPKFGPGRAEAIKDFDKINGKAKMAGR